MSGYGFGGGWGNQVGDLQNQVAPPTEGGGPGEPGNFNYGMQGTYNTLAQDMSRNFMGPYGFTGGMFNYTPYGNPYAMPPPVPPGQPPGQPPGPGGQPNWPGYPGDRPRDRDGMPQALPAQGGGMLGQPQEYGWQQGIRDARQAGLSGMSRGLGAAFRMIGANQGVGPYADLYMNQFPQTGGIPGGGRPSWPGFGYGGMPGYGMQMSRPGYGGMYGGGMHGSYGSPYARPWRGYQSANAFTTGGGGKPYMGGQPGDMVTTGHYTGPMQALW